MKFEQFLQREFDALGQPIVNDDMYERFNDWIGGLDPDEWIDLAEKWHAVLHQH